MLLTQPNNLSAVSLTLVNSLSAVSLTPTKNFRLFGYFPVTRITPAINFLPVSLTPLKNIHSQISPRIFEKIQNGPNGILGCLVDTDSCKKPEVENLVSDSL